MPHHQPKGDCGKYNKWHDKCVGKKKMEMRKVTRVYVQYKCTKGIVKTWGHCEDYCKTTPWEPVYCDDSSKGDYHCDDGKAVKKYGKWKDCHEGKKKMWRRKKYVTCVEYRCCCPEKEMWGYTKKYCHKTDWCPVKCEPYKSNHCKKSDKSYCKKSDSHKSYYHAY